VNLASLIAGMADLVASTSGPQIKVTVATSRDLPPAMADPNQLEMAILNLSVNARDAMPDGGMLRISAAAETIAPGHRSKLQPGSYVCLSVIDTGIGMDEATLARAVELFFNEGCWQGDRTRPLDGAWSCFSAWRSTRHHEQTGARHQRRALAASECRV
jgi:signal transduction histidine kinase